MQADREGESLLVDLDERFGHATLFLEASGGLARRLSSPERVPRALKFKSDVDPYLRDYVSRNVVEAVTGAQSDPSGPFPELPLGC